MYPPDSVLMLMYIDYHAENCPADQVTATTVTPAGNENVLVSGKPVHATKTYQCDVNT